MWGQSSSLSFYFPRECSRCVGESATESMERQWVWVERSGNVETTTTLTMTVPVCHDCKRFVEGAEQGTVATGVMVAVLGALVMSGILLASGAKNAFTTLMITAAIWGLTGYFVHRWLRGVLGIDFVRPVEKGAYLRFCSAKYQQMFDRANPAIRRRPEGYFVQGVLYLLYLTAAVYVPLFGVFFWLATFRDHRRRVMKWVILAVSLGITSFQIWRWSEGLPLWFPWLPFR